MPRKMSEKRKVEAMMNYSIQVANILDDIQKMCGEEEYHQFMIDQLGKKLLKKLYEQAELITRITIHFKSPGPGSELEERAEKIYEKYGAYFIGAGTFIGGGKAHAMRDMEYEISSDLAEALQKDLIEAGFEPIVD